MTPVRHFLVRVWRWLSHPGPIKVAKLPKEEPIKFFLTGPDLIERVARAIELNQSVVLAGPRGCGKSHCIGAAIEFAKTKDWIQGSVFLQGNREIPRDYLIEDEIAFRTQIEDGKSVVTPYRRSSPLFAFARRNAVTSEPELTSGTRRVDCIADANKQPWKTGNQIKCKRFALFLDEINRFSDGVLDSLLSVLEERKAVLAGEEYNLPVVVCMTMNPPGYDGSARKLSPPLAARISRTYRLCTADLDTLGDQIIRSKMLALERAYDENRNEQIKKGKSGGPEFPALSTEIIRKVGLVTLLCWGDISGQKAGSEYLTPATQEFLKQVMANDRVARQCMEDLTGMCQFGPDGRAGSDWLTTAIGVALEEADKRGDQKAVLRPDHLIDTVIESVAHKIYDSFSQASRPDLTVKKERAVETLARQVFNRPFFTRIVHRKIDDPSALQQVFKKHLITASDQQLHAALTYSGVVSDEDYQRWLNLTAALGPTATDLHAQLVEGKFLQKADTIARLPEGFSWAGDDSLARKLANLDADFAARHGSFAGPLSVAFRSLLTGTPPQLGPRRVTLEEEVAESYIARCVGVQAILAKCKEHNVEERALVLIVVRELEMLWALRLQPDTLNESLRVFKDELNKLTTEWRKQHQGSPNLPALVGLLEAIRGLLEPMVGAVAAAREKEAVLYNAFFQQLPKWIQEKIDELK